MRDVIPRAMLVGLILSLYAVRVRSEVAHARVTRTTLPFRIRVVPEYRALDLAL